jgi:hypothetical protein
METIENNKLIAEFMGCERYPIKGKEDGWIVKRNIDLKVCGASLQYGTSWDWLMPVVEKIEKESIYTIQTYYDEREDFIGWETNIFTLFPKDEICNFLDDSRFDSKIKATYKAVVEYIKWYNENKSKNS